jgi:hypothetical protein
MKVVIGIPSHGNFDTELARRPAEALPVYPLRL